MARVRPLRVLWDLADDPSGNVVHVAEHGVTQEEVEEVLSNPDCLDRSRTTGRRIAIAETSAGRALLVVFDEIDDTTVYPVTAYEIER